MDSRVLAYGTLLASNNSVCLQYQNQTASMKVITKMSYGMLTYNSQNGQYRH